MQRCVGCTMFEKILIVDDSLAARLMIKQYLSAVGSDSAQFLECSNGKIGLDTLKETSVDLVVTDMNMPEMDGYSFIKRLKASPRYNTIPIIIISSAANDDNKERFMDFGVNFVIGKPISPQVLYQALNTIKKEV